MLILILGLSLHSLSSHVKDFAAAILTLIVKEY